MEQENKYYTPDVENIRYGYEMEWLNKANESSFVLDGVDVDTWTKWDYEFQGLSLNGIRNMIADKRLRVPYLTKEQIEELGWKYVGSMTGGSPDTEQQEYYLSTNLVEYKMYKATNHSAITISGWFHDNPHEPTTMTLYRGECKDKNTLQYLMKLLKIQ